MARTRLVYLLLPMLVGAGCTNDPGPAASDATPPSSRAAPHLGGPSVDPVPVPDRPMDHLEKPIAHRLAPQAAAEGLSLDYLACPSWDGRMPERMRCTGYLDGVTAQVRVRLRAVAGHSIAFDAKIGDGVVATHNLVAQLRGHGYTRVDCGDRPAYRSRVGLKLVCAVTDHGHRKYVVATVTDRSGEVAITDY